MPFAFSNLNRAENLTEILKLESFKARQHTNISTKIIKENTDIFADILFGSFNDSVEKSDFQFPLKKTNITSVFKKGDRNSGYNYGPVSILPNMSKIFERCIFRQLQYTALPISYA